MKRSSSKVGNKAGTLLIIATLACQTLFISLMIAAAAIAQPVPYKFSKDDYMKYTGLYKGERFPDGRPKVSNEILERMKSVAIEEAWGVLQQHGYASQFEGGWVKTHDNPLLVGRAVTCNFIPYRADVNDVVMEEGKKQGLAGRDKHWIIDTLVKGDVIVADLFGKNIGGAFVGDNLANLIHTKTGTGMVVDGGCRDLAGVLELSNFYVFNRNWDPSTSGTYDKTMVIGMNVPIRIGRAAVLPGDVVLGLREGVIFIPAHLALEVVETSEVVRLKDEFGFARLRSGQYTAGQIDAAWTEAIKADFREWIKSKNIKLTPFQMGLLK
jgi:4-hydroxy-4-methyl-2-oxoglutarate aldolase